MASELWYMEDQLTHCDVGGKDLSLTIKQQRVLLNVVKALVPVVNHGPIIRISCGFEEIWYECPFCHYTAWPGQKFIHGENCMWEALDIIVKPLLETNE